MNSLQEIIGYRFKNPIHLKTALTHSAADHHDNYERMEFLGDSILGFIISEHLYHNYPNLSEGELTKFRSMIVCEASLYEVAEDIGLSRFVDFAKSENDLNAREKISILADVFEAVTAAIYLDSSSIAEAKRFVMTYMADIVKRDFSDYSRNDSKSYLQEIVQGQKKSTVTYTLVDSFGPDHDKTFIVNVLDGANVLGHGRGKSKKAAEQAAAQDALVRMGR
jgi:ribonuclease-3